jgi:chromate transporter
MVKESKLTIKTIWIPILATVLICSLGVSPICIVAAAGVGGILCGLYFHRKTFKN